MCAPVLAAIGPIMSAIGAHAGTIGAALSVATAAVGQYGAHQSGKAQVRAIDDANALQADQIAKAAGAEMTERARAARRERASMRAAGSAVGLNVDTSGSFVAALQASSMNQYNDQGVIAYNERGQQRARQTEATGRMSQIQIPSALSAALAIGSTAVGSFAATKPPKTKTATAGGHALNYTPSAYGSRVA